MSADRPIKAGASTSALQELRPLSLGEMLDRAFSICFKNIVPLSAIVFVVEVPQIALAYLALRPTMDLYDKLLGATQGAHSGAPVPLTTPDQLFGAYAQGGPYFALLVLFALVAVPLSNAAVVSAVSRAYLGRPVRFAECYGDAVPRWFSLLLLMLLWFLAASMAVVSLMLFVMLGGLLAGLLSTVADGLGPIAAIVSAVALFGGVLIIGVVGYFAGAYSFTAAVIEGLAPADAFASGIRRVFGGGRFWRSVRVAAAIIGIWLGFAIVGLAISGLAQFATHSALLGYAVSGAINALLYPFAFAVVAVSYYDVRVRSEGFDLELLAARLDSPPQQ